MSYHEQVHVIRHDLQRHHPPPMPGGFRADRLRTAGRNRAAQHRAAILRAPHHVIPEVADTTCGNLHLPGHASDYTDGLCQTIRFPCRLKTAVPSRGA